MSLRLSSGFEDRGIVEVENIDFAVTMARQLGALQLPAGAVRPLVESSDKRCRASEARQRRRSRTTAAGKKPVGAQEQVSGDRRLDCLLLWMGDVRRVSRMLR